MAYSKLTPPIYINADSVDNTDPLRRNYYGVEIRINGISEVYQRVCLNFANLTIELYDGQNDVKPIATISITC